jgi:hypothetical protein
MIADLRGVWWIEASWFDRLHEGVDASDLVVGAAQWPNDVELAFGLGENDPLAASSPN